MLSFQEVMHGERKDTDFGCAAAESLEAKNRYQRL
jgi:hypothetical protein